MDANEQGLFAALAKAAKFAKDEIAKLRSDFTSLSKLPGPPGQPRVMFTPQVDPTEIAPQPDFVTYPNNPRLNPQNEYLRP